MHRLVLIKNVLYQRASRAAIGGEDGIRTRKDRDDLGYPQARHWF
jgi:hypothetical protein